MRIITTYRNVNGTPKVLARGMGVQKTTNWDLSKSTDWNHGTAAGALILHKSSTMHPLTQQNGDNLAAAALRSIKAGASTHTASDDGQRHVFDV